MIVGVGVIVGVAEGWGVAVAARVEMDVASCPGTDSRVAAATSKPEARMAGISKANSNPTKPLRRCQIALH